MNPTPPWTWQALTLQLRTPFRVSYGVSETRQAFWLRLAGDAGWGESAIPPYYGISDEAIIAFWAQAAAQTRPWPQDLPEIADWVGQAGPAPARCALDLALHDRLARRRGLPLHRLLDAPPPAQDMPTSFTISLDTPAEMARLAAKAAAFLVLKIKLGGEEDEACVEAVRRARPDARLRIDANAAWTPEEAARHVDRLARFDLELIEQPVAKEDISGMGFVQARSPIPIVADESLQSLADLERLAAVGVGGINLKLMKVGGLAPGLAILRRARALGLKVMLGCMIETSLGVTAAAQLSGLADWIDLDAPLLITNDPFAGVRFDAQGRMRVPLDPGIGVTLRHTS
ncbi:MAG: dipeptide epimerase [Caldilineales bacterium]|nr:dipeptide epimerase [Caldilineales bacterium]